MTREQRPEPEITGQRAETPEEDITRRGVLERLMPIRRVEQELGFSRGPIDPGGQPVLDTENQFYLGLSGWNAAGGTSITKAVLTDAERHRDYFAWPACVHLAKEADRIGLEFMLSAPDQRGFGGEIGFQDDHLDTLSSVVALGQVTSRILLMSTVHTGGHLHPLHLSRLGGNIDHASNGRWGLNIVAGWPRADAEMCGLEPPDPDSRYEVGDEFTTLMKLWWTVPTAFQFDGQYFHSKHVHMCGPRPSRKPRPFLLSAAYSEAGIDFAAKHCDWLLCRSPSGDWDDVIELGRRASVHATHHYVRDLRALTCVYVVMAETDALAREEFEMLASMIDTEAADNFVRSILDQPDGGEGLLAGQTDANAATVREQVGESTYVRLALGLGSMHLVGSYDAVAERLQSLAAAGQQGAVLSFFDPLRGLHDLEDEIIPRLRRMGLRK